MVLEQLNGPYAIDKDEQAQGNVYHGFEVDQDIGQHQVGPTKNNAAVVQVTELAEHNARNQVQGIEHIAGKELNARFEEQEKGQRSQDEQEDFPRGVPGKGSKGP